MSAHGIFGEIFEDFGQVGDCGEVVGLAQAVSELMLEEGGGGGKSCGDGFDCGEGFGGGGGGGGYG